MDNKNYKVLSVPTGNTFTLAFPISTTVEQALASTLTRANLNTANIEDYGLFIPPNVESGKKGFWLDKTLHLHSYRFGEKDILHLNTRFRVLRYKLVDGTSKAVMIDDSWTVKVISDCICDKLGIQTVADEFSLRKPTPPGMSAKAMIWLHENSTLHEYDILPEDELEFGKKFFSADDRVDKDDPFALHLLYSEAQKAIIDGRYPCSRAEAINFAAIQMQIVYGDHQINVHKPGFISRAGTIQFLPLALRKDKTIEVEILAAHRLLIRTPDFAAKMRYIQSVRALKTYGITFFECTIPNPNPKKPPIGLWIGVTKNGLMRVDPVTGETVKHWHIEQLKRWSCDVDMITLDFGDHEGDYLVVQCWEANALSELIGGYIDILLRNRRDTDKVHESDEDEIGNEEIMSGLVGLGFYGITSAYDTPSSVGGLASAPMNPGQQMSGQMPGKPGMTTNEGEPGVPLTQHIRGPDSPSNNINVVDMGSSIKALQLLASELGGARLPMDTAQLKPEEWAARFKDLEGKIDQKLLDLLALAKMSPGQLNRQALDKRAADLTQDVRGLGTCARALSDLDSSNDPLLDGTKAFASSIGDILESLLRGAEKGSTGPEMAETLTAAEKAWMATKLLMQNPDLANYIDDATKLLLLECVNDAEMNLDQMVAGVTAASKNAPPPKKQQLLKEAERVGGIQGFPLGCLQHLIPAALDPTIRPLLHQISNDVGKLSAELVQKAKIAGYPADQLPVLCQQADGVKTALLNFQQGMKLMEQRTPFELLDLQTPAKEILKSIGDIRDNIRSPDKVVERIKLIAASQNKLATVTTSLANGIHDPETKDRIGRAAAAVANTLKELLAEARVYYNNPQNLQSAQKTQGIAGRLEEATLHLVDETDTLAALHNLRYNAKLATASALKLSSASAAAGPGVSNPNAKAELLAMAKGVRESIGTMLDVLQDANEKPDDLVSNSKLLEVCRTQVPFYSQLSSSARGVAARAVAEPLKKQQLSKASQEATDNVMKLHNSIQDVSDRTGVTEIEKAMAEFDSTKAELETAAYFANEGLLEPVPGQTRENSQALLNVAADGVEKAAGKLIGAAKAGDKLPEHLKQLAFGIGQVATAARTMATCDSDRDMQKRVIGSAKDLLDDTLGLIGLARELALDPNNPDKKVAVDRARQKFEATLGNLRGKPNAADTKDVSHVLADLDKQVKGLTKNSPNRVGFKDASDALETSTQALGAAVTQLVGVAKSNPAQLGPASKMTGNTVGDLLCICSDAASGAPGDSTANGILATARALAEAMKALLNASAQVANQKTPQSLANLAESQESVAMSIDNLLANLGNTISPEAEKSLNRIKNAIKGIETGRTGASATTREQLLNQFLQCARDMAKATTNLVTSAHVSSNRQGAFSTEASELAKEMIMMAKSAEMSDGSKPTMTLEGAKLIKLADYIVQNPGNTPKVNAKVKKITDSGAKLINVAKEAAKLEQDFQKREAIVRAAQNAVNGTTALATAARAVNPALPQPEATQKVAQIAKGLK